MSDKLLFTCRVCGCDVGTHPIEERNGEEVGVQGVCPEHCEDHEYEHDGYRNHYCKHCGEEPPADWYYSDDDCLGGGYASAAVGGPVGWPASAMNGNAAERHKNPAAWDRWAAFCQANGHD